MLLTIAAVGRAKHPPERALVAHYLKLTRWEVRVKEIADAPTHLPTEQRTAREAEAILKMCGPSTRMIALDARGKALTSPQIYDLVRAARLASVKEMIFVIGGQDGLHERVLTTAFATISFGVVTWPHQLLRAMLAEQLYRAYTIDIGHPYHAGH